MALQTPVPQLPVFGSQMARQTPAAAEVGAQIRFHSQESTFDGSQAAPSVPWLFGAEQKPSKAPVESKSIHEQTVPEVQVDAYGLQIGLQTGPNGPPSSMQSKPALQASPGLQIWPLPPVTVQVCAVVLQPMPFLQSVSAAHWTQVP